MDSVDWSTPVADMPSHNLAKLSIYERLGVFKRQAWDEIALSPTMTPMFFLSFPMGPSRRRRSYTIPLLDGGTIFGGSFNDVSGDMVVNDSSNHTTNHGSYNTTNETYNSGNYNFSNYDFSGSEFS